MSDGEKRQDGPYDRIGETDWFACNGRKEEPTLGVPEWRTIIMVTYFAIIGAAFMAVVVLLAKWANGELR